MLRLLMFLSACLLCISIEAQSLDWYLSGAGQPFLESIPTPEVHLGHQVGAWHADHSAIHGYMEKLAGASDRVVMLEYGRSHENRPLSVLVITSPANHARLEAIKQLRREWCDPTSNPVSRSTTLPGVLYQGYSIHGNEPSGGNASMVVAWYLAASQAPEVDSLLEDNIILLDPCFNPDGFQRFATWVNSNRSFVPNGDPATRELNEPWPGGRTNHYWFDLNRDWLLLQQPESRGRVSLFQEWKPNILTDHHEMGSNSTFFFMPGIQSRTNPLTPPQNQDLTFVLADYHAEALDNLRSLYFTEQSFDDFYIGKGSTYPDVNGGIGILFEQASSRGHSRETSSGLLTFPFTIRNQVTTSLSTLRGLQQQRETLLDYQRSFFVSAIEMAQQDPRAGFVFQSPEDSYRTEAMLDLLDQHHIRWAPLEKPLTVGKSEFKPGHAYGVVLEQPQYRLILGLFDTITQFEDSLFYDVSAWTLPLALGLEYTAVSKSIDLDGLLGISGTRRSRDVPPLTGEGQATAYVFDWSPFLSPRLTYSLLEQGYRLRVATVPFSGLTDRGTHSFRPGAVVLTSDSRQSPPNFSKINAIAQECGIEIHTLTTGLTPDGPDLGSRDFPTVKQPRVLLVAGEGIRSYDAGEIWHLFDQRYEMPVTIVSPDEMRNINPDQYTVIVLPSGSSGAYNRIDRDRLAQWVKEGGTLIAFDRAIPWLQSAGLADIESRKNAQEALKGRQPYSTEQSVSGAQIIGGALFKASLDLTHPLCFGYERSEVALFKRGTVAIEWADNPRADPAVFAPTPLLSGYASAENQSLIGNSSAVQVHGIGSGTIICFAHNPVFRGYWLGTTKLFANAVFFGSILNGDTKQR